MNVSELARICDLSRPTVYKYLKMGWIKKALFPKWEEGEFLVVKLTIVWQKSALIITIYTGIDISRISQSAFRTVPFLSGRC